MNQIIHIGINEKKDNPEELSFSKRRNNCSYSGNCGNILSAAVFDDSEISDYPMLNLSLASRKSASAYIKASLISSITATKESLYLLSVSQE